MGKYLWATASYTDEHDPGKSAQAVSDNPARTAPANNTPPQFPSTENGARSVDENTAAGQNIGAPVAATDIDTGDLLTYSLSGADAASFDIIRATGQLLTKAPLDREATPTYTVTVKAVDPSAEVVTITVTITINDVDEPPVVSGPDVVDYPENGTNDVATYTATDPEGVSITWSLEGDDSSHFRISGGVLKFDSSPDHDAPADADTNNIYLMTVKASDGTNTAKLAVEVTVSNVNEPPAFPASETGQRTVAENTAADENIGDLVAATDPDADDALTYKLGGTDAASFDIDEITGQLKTKAGLNFEDQDTYTVEVLVSDGQDAQGAVDPTADDTIDVTITVTSVNEAPEFPSTEDGTRAIAENTPAAPGHRRRGGGHRPRG